MALFKIRLWVMNPDCGPSASAVKLTPIVWSPPLVWMSLLDTKTSLFRVPERCTLTPKFSDHCLCADEHVQCLQIFLFGLHLYQMLYARYWSRYWTEDHWPLQSGYEMHPAYFIKYRYRHMFKLDRVYIQVPLRSYP